MMGWYQIISFVFTNGLRIFLCLYLVMVVLKLSGDRKRVGVLSACTAVFITLLSCLPIPQIFIAGAEIIIIMLFIRRKFKAELRMILFLTFFYEITVALWEFIISAIWGLYSDQRDSLTEICLSIWRQCGLSGGLCMALLFLLSKQVREETESYPRLRSQAYSE